MSDPLRPDDVAADARDPRVRLLDRYRWIGLLPWGCSTALASALAAVAVSAAVVALGVG